jgi:hypothetical protein
VVGIVATIMAVVSSDGLRLGGGIPLMGRNDSAGDPSSDSGAAPIIATASELNGEGAKQPIDAVPTKVAAVEADDPPSPATSAPLPPVAPPAVAVKTSANSRAVPDLRTEKPPEPAPVAVASLQPAATVKAEPTSTPSAAPLAELRTGRMVPPSGSSALLTTASVSTRETISGSQPFSATFIAPAKTSTAPPVAADPVAGAASIWPEDAATCPRDWVAGDAAEPAAATDCVRMIELIASIASDQSALEEAAAMRAESLAALAPRIPSARPDVLPVVKPVRLSRRSSSSWPAAPPPSCGAGRHAKWRFVDRKAGTKEWYCR